MIWTGFEPGTLGRKANTITAELKRILFSSVVMVLAFHPGVPGSNPVQILNFCHAFFSSVVMVLVFRPGVPGSNPAQILYFCHAFIHFFLRYELCS